MRDSWTAAAAACSWLPNLGRIIRGQVVWRFLLPRPLSGAAATRTIRHAGNASALVVTGAPIKTPRSGSCRVRARLRYCSRWFSLALPFRVLFFPSSCCITEAREYMWLRYKYLTAHWNIMRYDRTAARSAWRPRVRTAREPNNNHSGTNYTLCCEMG